VLKLILIGFLITGWAFPAAAGEKTLAEPAPWIPPSNAAQPANSILGNAINLTSSGTEKPQSLNGAKYTVLSPIFTGADGNLSYIRFPNVGSTVATTYVTVVGSPTGHVYGTAFVTVAPLASPQYAFTDIMSAIGVSGFFPGDDSYSFYLQSPQGGHGVGFQHVIFSTVSGFFENASLCTYIPTIDYSILNQGLVNVHTSLFSANYPSVVFLHNYASFPVSYLANIFDSQNGAYLGSFYFNMQANATVAENFSDIEPVIGFHPNSSQFHVNIIFQAQNTGNIYYGIAAQAINNRQLNSYTNMSVACAVNP